MEILIQYKEVTAVALAFILEVICILLFKKRPKIVDNSILFHLCDWIMQAELEYKKGSDKLSFVLKKAKDYLGDDYVEADVKKVVEYILSNFLSH